MALKEMEILYFMNDSSLALPESAPPGSKAFINLKLGNVRILQARAEWLYHQQKFCEAITVYELVLASFEEEFLKKSNGEIYEGLFHAFMAVKKFTDAEKISKLLVEMFPEKKDMSCHILYNSAHVQFKLGKYIEASAALEIGLQRNVYHIRAWWLLSKTFYQMHRPRLCLRALIRTQKLTRRDRHSQYPSLLTKIELLLTRAHADLILYKEDADLTQFQAKYLATDPTASNQEDIPSSDSDDDVLKVEMM
jgi:tetratricopeptide (TPR) repeat protein